MTPFEIKILLYYQYTGEDDYPEKNAPIFEQTINRFVELGLILKYPIQPAPCYRYKGNSEALKAYVEALAKVPLPVQKWIVE